MTSSPFSSMTPIGQRRNTAALQDASEVLYVIGHCALVTPAARSTPVRSRWSRVRLSRTSSHVHPVAAGNYPSNSFACFGIHSKRFILYALLQFETPDWFRRVGGFVDVNWHLALIPRLVAEPSVSLLSRSVLSSVQAIPCERHPADQPARKYAHQKSLAALEAGSKANALIDSYRSRRAKH